METRKPDQTLKHLLEKQPSDALLKALQRLTSLILERSGLSEMDLGVFGSLLHGFYHPFFSDLDFVVYGKERLGTLQETLEALFLEEVSPLRNEFETEESLKDKEWRFVNYSPAEFVWHQKRKVVYAVFHYKRSGRKIKTEFEPVKRWEEIQNEYDADTRILKRGWIKTTARVIDDSETAFMPSIYKIELDKILEGLNVDDIQRIVSFVEEFRMQAEKDEEVYVEGNLEQVVTSTGTFHQITLTYGPRYYEQVLKVLQPV
jgi:predicted nucleotidyltransferase